MFQIHVHVSNMCNCTWLKVFYIVSFQILQRADCYHHEDAVIHPLRPCLVPKNFHPKVSHRILRHMHGVLNVDDKKLITQLGEKSRDETFEPN